MPSATKPDPNVSLVIPAYNEEDRIEGVLKNYAGFHESYEVIVVCNGCTDATPRIVAGWSKKNPRIKLLNFDEKLGKGGAIIEGFKVAKGELIGFVDADESVDAEEYLKLIHAMKKLEIDGAIGSRRVEGADILVQQPLMRRIASRGFNLLIRYIFGLSYLDTQCGAKVFGEKAVKEVINELRSSGYEFDVELLWRLKNKRYKIVEMPIKWSHEKASKFSLFYAPRMLVDIMRIRIKSPFG